MVYSTREAIELVYEAKSYTDLFGIDMPTELDGIRIVNRRARRLARFLHPDQMSDKEFEDSARDAYIKLQQLLEDAITALKNGTYGQRSVIATITTRRMKHDVVSMGPVGDIVVSYLATSTPIMGDSIDTFIKIARDSSDNDLIQSESSSIRRLRGSSVSSQFAAFLPDIIDTFSIGDASGRRSGTVFAQLEGFYSLAEVAQRFGGAIDPLDMVWIFRRLLVALGFAHDQGVIHGAILPQNIMIHPDLHGLVLVDWCASVQSDTNTYSPVKVLVEAHRGWYPPEVIAKEAPSPATDLTMAARTMISCLGGDSITGVLEQSIPRPLRAFLRGCLSDRRYSRPQNAWIMLHELDELLQYMGSPYYPRRFRPMTLPIRRV